VVETHGQAPAGQACRTGGHRERAGTWLCGDADLVLLAGGSHPREVMTVWCWPGRVALGRRSRLAKLGEAARATREAEHRVVSLAGPAVSVGCPRRQLQRYAARPGPARLPESPRPPHECTSAAERVTKDGPDPLGAGVRSRSPLSLPAGSIATAGKPAASRVRTSLSDAWSKQVATTALTPLDRKCAAVTSVSTATSLHPVTDSQTS
jgi:hypothetical protein